MRLIKYIFAYKWKYFVGGHNTAIEECISLCLLSCFVYCFTNDHSTLYYFFSPLAFFSMIAVFFTFIEIFHHNHMHFEQKKPALLLSCCIILCIILVPTLYDLKKFRAVLHSLKHQRSVHASTIDVSNGSLFENYFPRNSLFDNKPYTVIRLIRNISRHSPSVYGIFTSDGSFNAKIQAHKYIFYYQALTGLVRYIPLYRTNEGIYATSGALLTHHQVYPYYGLKNLKLSPSATIDAAMKSAKDDGKKFLFHIVDNDVYLIDLEANSSIKLDISNN